MSHRLRVLLLACAATFAAASGPASAATPAWWQYDRPATSGSVHRQVAVPMRDGVRLGCDLHLPARGRAALPGRFPSIIYEVTPYAAATPLYLEQGAYFAARGYSAITCNVRGTGRSGGAFPQPNQPAEATDAYDLVEWVAAQPWSTGRVGQTGESYGGMMTYRAAASGAPHLVAAVPQQSPNDLYLDDVYPGGIPATPGTRQMWPLVGSVASLGRIGAARLFAVQRRHPTHDAFWDQIAIDRVLDRIDVPVLALAGWNDPLFRDGAIRNYERLVARRGTATTFLIAGPWTHGGPLAWPSCRLVSAACAGPQLVPRGALLAWMDHWVAERTGAPLPSAPVTSYEGPMGTGAGWQERATVFPAASDRTLALTGAGGLSDDAGEASTARWTATPGDGLWRRVPVLRFTSAPLQSAQVLVGRPSLHLRLASTRPDANLVAVLRSIRPDGSSRPISEGWLRASHRESHAHPAPLPRGGMTDMTLELEPLDLQLPAGSRLELRIGSGSALEAQPLSRRTITLATGAGGSTLRFATAD